MIIDIGYQETVSDGDNESLINIENEFWDRFLVAGIMTYRVMGVFG